MSGEAVDEKGEQRDFGLTLAWHVAALGRVKRLPPLRQLLQKPKPGALSKSLRAAFSTLPRREPSP